MRNEEKTSWVFLMVMDKYELLQNNPKLTRKQNLLYYVGVLNKYFFLITTISSEVNSSSLQSQSLL